MEPKLNKMQQVAVERCEYWYKNPDKRKRPWFEISGPAGSGKTFLVHHIMKHLNIDEKYVRFMAFVGKATLALRLAGVPAKTIHSTIYKIVAEYETDENNHLVLYNGFPKKIQKFKLKKHMEEDLKWFVLDEGGMVGGQIGADILSFGIPLMVLGDLRQLPPVMANRMFLQKPDVILNQIMRQEEGSPIIYLSKLAYAGIRIPVGNYGECKVIWKSQLTETHLRESDVVITMMNKTRDRINGYIRKNIYGIKENKIVEGDKLICRQNKFDITLNEDISLVNGLIGYVEKVHSEPIHKNALMEIDFRPEFCDESFKNIPINYNHPFKPYEERVNTNPMFSGGNILMEFGHCITCHLSQGSQYDNVMVYVESYGNSLYFRQWFYTAITRAKKKVIIVI